MNAAEINAQQDNRRQAFVQGQYRDRHFKLEKGQGWAGPRPVGLPSALDGYGFLTNSAVPEIMEQEQGNGTHVRLGQHDSEG